MREQMMKQWPALEKQLADAEPAAKIRDEAKSGATAKPATKPKLKAGK
jgi:hypothetical protein